MRATGPSSAARRKPSAVALPWPLKRRLSSPCVPPSKLASPPNRRAVAPTTAKPFCVKSTRPFAAPSSGVSALMRTSLPASARLPLTVVVETAASGMSSASFSSAGPVALALASDFEIQPPIGVVLTTFTMSASGPFAVASSATTGRSPRFGICPLTGPHSIAPSTARALRSSSVERSITSSPFTPVSAGHCGASGANAKVAFSA